MSFCIPRKFIQTLKDAAAKKEVDLSSINQMTSQQRKEHFAKFTNEDVGDFLNKEWEKAIANTIKGKTDALKGFIDSAFKDPKLKQTALQNFSKKIEGLNDVGAFDKPEMFESLIEDSLGARVSKEEAKKVIEMSSKIEKVAEKLKIDEKDTNLTHLGDLFDHFDDNVEYLKAKDEANKYLESLRPSSKIDVLTKSVRRGLMLSSVKSFLTNIVANIPRGAQIFVSKRVSALLEDTITGNFKSGVFKDASKTWGKGGIEYMQKAVEVYKKTGYDLTRMLDMTDIQKTLGETVMHSQGKGLIRKAGRFFEEGIQSDKFWGAGRLLGAFKGMGTADVAFSAFQFQDSARLFARRYAKKAGISPEELFKETLKLNTKNTYAQIIRQLSVADAQKATYTNDSYFKKVALQARDLLDKATPGFNLGTYKVPFAGVPANVVQANLDDAGLGAFKGLYKIIKGSTKKDRTMIYEGINHMSEMGVAMIGAAILVESLKPEDYSGIYDPKKTDENQLKNSTNNAIRVGNTWISLDYFSSMGGVMSGMLEAKKAEGNKGLAYVKGIGKQALNVPGLEEVRSSIEWVEELFNSGKKAANDLDALPGSYLASYVPGVLTDIAKMSDEYERDIKTGWETPLGKYFDIGAKRFVSSIPFARETMKPSVNVLGEERKTQGITQLLFGARVKTANTDKAAEEVSNLAKEGQAPTLKNLDWMRSKKLDELKEKLGKDKFREAKIEFGKSVASGIKQATENQEYKKMTAEEKKKEINDIAEKKLNELYEKNDIFDANVDPVKAKARIAMKKELEKYPAGKELLRIDEENKGDQMLTEKQYSDIMKLPAPARDKKIKEIMKTRAETKEKTTNTTKFKELILKNKAEAKEFISSLDRKEQLRLYKLLNHKENAEYKKAFK